jgi:hypothetical protein
VTAEETLAELERRLPGPRRWREDVLAEIRDGLHDAAEAHVDAGSEPGEAERRAIDDFGSVDAVAFALRRGAVVRRGRRTAALACVPAVLGPMWDAGWRAASWSAWRQSSTRARRWPRSPASRCGGSCAVRCRRPLRRSPLACLARDSPSASAPWRSRWWQAAGPCPMAVSVWRSSARHPRRSPRSSSRARELIAIARGG